MASESNNKSATEALTQAVSKLSDILATAAATDGQKKYLDLEGLTEFLQEILKAPTSTECDYLLVVKDGKLRRLSFEDLIAALNEEFSVLPEDETVIDLDYQGTEVTRDVECNTSWEVTQE